VRTDLSRPLRLGAATLLLAGGAVHLQLHLDGYATERIGWSFVANASLSALGAAYLVLRRDRIGPVAGLVLSIGSLLALLLTRVGDGLLGFRETGLNPAPEAAMTLVTEALAVLLLIVLLVAEQRQPSTPGTPPASTRRPDRPLVAGPVGQ
jgi:hypothetical protein